MKLHNIIVEQTDAFLLAAAMLHLMEPEALTVEQRLHSAARTQRARELLNDPGRVERLMSQLHLVAYGHEMPPIPPTPPEHL